MNKWPILFGEHMLNDFWILKKGSGEIPAMVAMMTRHILLFIQQSSLLVKLTGLTTNVYVAVLNSSKIFISLISVFTSIFSSVVFMLHRSNIPHVCLLCPEIVWASCSPFPCLLLPTCSWSWDDGGNWHCWWTVQCIRACRTCCEHPQMLLASSVVAYI
jgi:hypothetical protein